MILDLGSKKITIRGWKGRDKKAFIQALKEKEISESVVMDKLVYSCIEEDVILSLEEFKFVLSRIRALSLGEEVEIGFHCNNCAEIFTQKFLLKDIIRFTYAELKEIKEQKIHIKLGEIRNKTIYLKKIAEDSLYDLLLRIESFNGNSTLTLDEIMEKFDDLDLNILTNIIEKYESAKFKVQDHNTVICPECKDEVLYEFDEIPDFFPESWFSDEE